MAWTFDLELHVTERGRVEWSRAITLAGECFEMMHVLVGVTWAEAHFIIQRGHCTAAYFCPEGTPVDYMKHVPKETPPDHRTMDAVTEWQLAMGDGGY